MLNIHLPHAVGAWLSRLTGQEREQVADHSDTVMHWPPTPARVLGGSERHAHKCIAKALALEHPKGFLLAHVPVYKLVRVPLHHSYREWLSRTGLLTVDFALCDEHGYVRSVVLMPLPDEQPRLLRRRERLLRVLGATTLPIMLWDRHIVTDEGGEQLQRLLFPKSPPSPAAGYYIDMPQTH